MKKILCIIGFLAAFAVSSHAHAQTSYTVHNVPPMYLSKGISATATDITLSGPVRNGTTQTFPTTSGGILEISNLRFTELVHYTGATVNATTKEITLLGATRGYCWDQNTFASCESGRQWARGTKVILNNDMRLFNQSAKIDIFNSLTGSGAISCDATTQPCLFPGQYTTAQINAFTFTNSDDFHILYDTTLGVAKYYSPDESRYISFGSGSTADATTTTSGKGELATITDLQNHTISGDAGPTFLWVDNTTVTSTGSTQAWKIPLLNDDGVLSGALLGTNYASEQATGTGFLRIDGTYALPTAGAATYLISATGSSFNVGLGGETEVVNNTGGYVYNIGNNLLEQGDVIKIVAAGVVTIQQNKAVTIDVQLEGTDLGSIALSEGGAGTSTANVVIEAMITIRSVGASGGAVVVITAEEDGANVSLSTPMAVSTTATTIDTTGDLNLQMSVQPTGGSSTLTEFSFHSFSAVLINH